MNRTASYIYTDLACEAYERTDSVNASGVSYNEYDADGIKITDLRITNSEGEKALGKPVGSYITIDTGRLWEQEYEASLHAIKLIAANLNDLMHSACKKIDSVLVCGLGNRNITPDAIGPLTIDGVTVTRHIKEEDPALYNQMGAYDIAAVNAGVVGQTGVETAEIIGSVVKTVKPSLIIAVDALAARNASRLATTIQMTDTGVRPGSGIGQKRREISRQTMNVPVIAIGVPTVVSSSTLVYDALDEASAKVSPKLTEILENGKNFFVSLNESDVVVNKMAHVIAEAINHTLLAE